MFFLLNINSFHDIFKINNHKIYIHMLYIIFYICILIAKEKGLEDVTEKMLFFSEVDEFANYVFCGNRRKAIYL